LEGVKDIVERINFYLRDSFIKNGFGDLSLFGISETVTREEQSFPVFFKTNQGTWAGFDDRKEVILYHKLNSVQSSLNSANAYGDSFGEMVNRYSMNLVVYFKSQKVKPDEMFAFIQAVLPESPTIENSNFTYIRTSVLSAILNTMQVFLSEYKGIAYSLKPEQSLINISYIIESRFKKGCFNCC
jgi:hypothetical protein